MPAILQCAGRERSYLAGLAADELGKVGGPVFVWPSWGRAAAGKMRSELLWPSPGL